jgi:hypothetical protein
MIEATAKAISNQKIANTVRYIPKKTMKFMEDFQYLLNKIIKKN